MDNVNIDELKKSLKGKEFNFGKSLSYEEQTALILACKNGDEEGFEILCNGILGLIYTFITDKAGTIIKSKILTWDELVNIFKGVLLDCINSYNFDNGSRFISYFYSAMRNKLNYIYNNAKKRGDLDPYKVSLDDKLGGDDKRTYGEFIADTKDETVNFEQRVLDRITLERYLKLLPKDYLYIIENYYFKEISLQKIADQLGVVREFVRLKLADVYNLLKYLFEKNGNDTPDFSCVSGAILIKKIIELNDKLPEIFDGLDFKTEVFPYLDETERDLFKAVYPKFFSADNFYDKVIKSVDIKADKFNAMSEKLVKIRKKKDTINEILSEYGEDITQFRAFLNAEQGLVFDEYLMSTNPISMFEFFKQHKINKYYSVIKQSIFKKFDELKKIKRDVDIFVENNGGYNFLVNFFSSALDKNLSYILFNYIINYNKVTLSEIASVLNINPSSVSIGVNKIQNMLDVFFGRVIRNRYYRDKRIDFTKYSLSEKRSLNIKKRLENLKQHDNLLVDDIADCFQKLSKKSQEILIHYLINGYSIARIASLIGVDKDYVYDRFLSAKKEIIDLLAFDYESLPNNESVERKTQMFWKFLYPTFVKKINSIDYKKDLYPSLNDKYKFVIDNFLAGRGDKLLGQEVKDLGITNYSKILKNISGLVEKIVEQKAEIQSFYNKYGGKEVVDDFRSIIDEKGKIVLDNYVLSYFVDAFARTKKLINQPTYNIIYKRDWIYKTFDELMLKKEECFKFIAEHGGRKYLEDFAETLIPKQKDVLFNYLMDYHYITIRELENRLELREDYIFSALPDMYDNFERYAKRRADIDAIIESAGGMEVVRVEFYDKLKDFHKVIFDKVIIAYNPMTDKTIADLCDIKEPTVASARKIILERFKKFCLAKANGQERVVPIKRRSRQEFISKYGYKFLLETFATAMLTDKEQSVLEGIMINNMTYNDFALISGMKPDNIHSRTVSIKKKLSIYDERKIEVDTLIENAGGEELVTEKLFNNLSETEQIIFINSIVSYFPDKISVLMQKANVSKEIGYQIIEYLKEQIKRLTKEKENYQFNSYEEYRALKRQRF